MKISCFADSIQLLLLFRSSNNSADEQKRKKDFAKNLLFVTHILHNDWLGSTGKHNENDNKYKKKHSYKAWWYPLFAQVNLCHHENCNVICFSIL